MRSRATHDIWSEANEYCTISSVSLDCTPTWSRPSDLKDELDTEQVERLDHAVSVHEQQLASAQTRKM